eukprot:1184072-Alexandrium_andersonii.AAC.1
MLRHKPCRRAARSCCWSCAHEVWGNGNAGFGATCVSGACARAVSTGWSSERQSCDVAGAALNQPGAPL